MMSSQKRAGLFGCEWLVMKVLAGWFGILERKCYAFRCLKKQRKDVSWMQQNVSDFMSDR
jgi:hypothetical protein